MNLLVPAHFTIGWSEFAHASSVLPGNIVFGLTLVRIVLNLPNHIQYSYF